jgi:hypothetical protein
MFTFYVDLKIHEIHENKNLSINNEFTEYDIRYVITMHKLVLI